MKNSLIILAFFVAGVLLGISEMLPDQLIKTDLSMYALYGLMFLVGIGIGADKKSWSVLLQMNIKIFLVPIGVIFGTFMGSAIVSIFLPELKLAEVLAVGAGFGYYSLSSIVIGKVSGETIGIIALLSNIFREVGTLVLTPVLVKYFGKLAPIAAGGATTSDTTLPVIMKYAGKENVLGAVIQGIVLTLLVPLIISFIYGF